MGMRDKFGIKWGELGEVSLPGNHILMLTETWTTDISPPPDLPGYVVIHRPGKQGSRGRAMRGLAVYVAESISHLVSICSSHGSSETLWIKLEASIGLERDLYMGLCYFPPKAVSLESPFTILDSDIEFFSALGNVMLAGDFNARTANLRDCLDDNQLRQQLQMPLIINPSLPERQNEDQIVNEYGKHLADLALSHSLAICNGRTKLDTTGSCTHRAFNTGESGRGGASLVDYFLVDYDLFGERVETLKVGGAFPVSDHFPVDLVISLKKEIPVQTAHVGSDIFKLSEEGFTAFKAMIATPTLRNDVISESFQKATSSQAAATFTAYIRKAAACCFPKKAPQKSRTYRSKVWYDNDCKLLRSRYRALMQANGLPWQLRDLKREYKILTRSKRRKYEDQKGHTFVTQVAKDSAQFWKRFRREQPCIKIRSRKIWQEYFETLLSETELATPLDISSRDEQLWN